MSATVEIVRTTPKWWTAKVVGTVDEQTIDLQIRAYQEILDKGIARLCIDLTQADSSFGTIHARAQELNQIAMKFSRVAFLVADAKASFTLKATAKAPEDRFQFFYDIGKLQQWLGE